MQIMFEDDSSLNYDVQESLNEATGKTEKKYYIRGTFSTIGQRNRNGRIYPRPLWEREVQAYQVNLANGSINSLMEVEHPPRTNVDPMKAVAKIQSLRIEGDKVIGEAILLDNPDANQLKTLIDNGIKISVSSRGCGNVVNGIVKDFKLITYDIVANPSDFGATMNGVCESHLLTEGVVQGLEFKLDDNGHLVPLLNEAEVPAQLEPQTENPEKVPVNGLDITEEEKFTSDEVSEAVIEKFDTFIGSLLKTIDSDTLKAELMRNEAKLREDLPEETFFRKIRSGRIRISADKYNIYNTNFADPNAKVVSEVLDTVDLHGLYEKFVQKMKRYPSFDVKKLKAIYVNGSDVNTADTLNGLRQKYK